MNKLTFIGNLTIDPKRDNVNGKSVVNFSVAVNDSKDRTSFYNVSVWNESTGAACMQYLAKGRKVYVEGLPSARAYTNKEGRPAASIQVLANMVEFLSPAGGGGNNAPAGNGGGYSQKATKVPTYEVNQDLPWEE